MLLLDRLSVCQTAANAAWIAVAVKMGPELRTVEKKADEVFGEGIYMGEKRLWQPEKI